MSIRNIFIDGDCISYRKIGEGFPIVLIHGFGEDGNIWDNVTSVLEEKYLLIIPDIPGSGMSDGIKKEGVTIDDYAGLFKKILDQEGIYNCIMIGHSMGGYITLAFEEKFPEILRSFGLFHSSAYRDDSEKIETRLRAIDFIQAYGAKAFLKKSIPALFFDTTVSKDAIDILLKKGEMFKGETLIQYYKAMITRPDRTGILKNTPKPVFIIAGQHDTAIPFAQSLSQSHIPQQTFINILRFSSHMGMIEEKDNANDCLMNILQSIT